MTFCIIQSYSNDENLALDPNTISTHQQQYRLLFAQLPWHMQDVTQGQIISELMLVWIQSFLSPGCLITVKEPIVGGEEMDSGLVKLNINRFD